MDLSGPQPSSFGCSGPNWDESGPDEDGHSTNHPFVPARILTVELMGWHERSSPKAQERLSSSAQTHISVEMGRILN